VSAPRTHDSDVSGIGAQRRLEQWYIELGVVCQYTNGRASIEGAVGEPLMWPRADDLVGVLETGCGGKNRARITDGDVESK
jgi:hypothetical protein